jgi:hypothetical protein
MKNEDRRKRRGRSPVPDPRTHCISVRLNDAELALLNCKRGDLDKGEWLRCAALDKLPSIIPEPNQEKWLELANAANNLNQVARKLNALVSIDEVDQVELEFIRNTLVEFRAALLGVRN